MQHISTSHLVFLVIMSSADFVDPLDSENECGDALEEIYNRAASHLEKLVNQLDQTTLLAFYGLYKQSTVGPCNTSKPGFFSIQARAKWNAWNELGNLSKSDAMSAYIDKLNEIDPQWDTVGKSTDGEKSKKSYWVSVSTPMAAADDNDASQTTKTFIDHVKDGNLDEIKSYFTSQVEVSDGHGGFCLINEFDESGLGPIHWAADRGHSHILEELLSNGADVNLVDTDAGQTALHYAISCGHLECVRILKKYGADPTIKDFEEATCYDVANEMNDEGISEILKS